MRLYLIRHAESANNAVYGTDDEVSSHKPDPEITETGHQQGKLLGAHLMAANVEPRQHPYETTDSKNYNLTHVYCSLMTRSLLTAAYISEAIGIPTTVLHDIFEKKGLYEINQHGEEIGVAGPGRSYFVKRFPNVNLPIGLSEAGWWNRPVESDEDFLQRVSASMDSIIQKHGGSNDKVAMVVHGDYIDQCINQLLGVKRHEQNYQSAWVSNWALHNTSISRIDIVDGSRTVVYLNRIDHLTPDLVTW